MARKLTNKAKAYMVEYQKENCKRAVILLHKEHDKDIIDYLETIGNKNAYLKDLIRKDMNASK